MTAKPDPSTFQEFTTHELLGALNEVEAKKAPEVLFVAGDPRLLREGLRVSIVGTRTPTSMGADRTRALTLELVRRGITVMSGLAKGVDTIAHRTTIEAGGRTAAVLGTALDNAYPAENRELQHLIMLRHVAVSQFPVGGPHLGGKAFPMRNRTMALLSDATVIVEAGESSGTLHQGWEALRLGRPLFLLESLLATTGLTWPAEMLNFGAIVLNRDNLDEALREIPGRTRGELAF